MIFGGFGFGTRTNMLDFGTEPYLDIDPELIFLPFQHSDIGYFSTLLQITKNLSMELEGAHKVRNRTHVMLLLRSNVH